MSVEFDILGPLRVRRDGVPVELRGDKPRAVLALLLASPNRVVGIASFADQIWEREPDEIAGNLQVLVSNLRKALGAEVIRTQGAGYTVVVPDDALDLTRFRAHRAAGDEARADRRAGEAAAHYERALALWQGERALEDVRERFADTYAEALARDLQATRHAHLEALIALGRNPTGELTAACRRAPLDAGLCGLLLIALTRDGRQVDAADEYHWFRERYDDELGANPPDALRALWAAVSRGELPAGHYESMPTREVVATVVDPGLASVRAVLEYADGSTAPVSGRIVIGRADGDLVIPDAKISKAHAVLSPTPEGYVLTDLHSTNGTFVNGLPVVVPTLLADGDTVLLGDTALVFRRV
jgi:DNA-binding SARP family transcriptional activator